MNKILLIAICSLLSLENMAQQINTDDFLRQLYGVEYLDNLKTSNPERVDYLRFYVENAYTIIEISKDSPKGELIKNISDVPFIERAANKPNETAFNLETFNFLFYDFKRDKSNRTYYRIDNTNQVIAFYSVEELSKMYNKQKGNE